MSSLEQSTNMTTSLMLHAALSYTKTTSKFIIATG